MSDQQPIEKPVTKRYYTLGYVKEPRKGPLSVTEIDEASVTIVTFLYGCDGIRFRLLAGAPLQTIINETKNLQRTVVRIPLASLRDVSWFEGRNDMVFGYEEIGKRRKTTTYVSLPEDRVGLMEALQSKFAQPFRTQQAAAGVFQVAWANILGAVVSIVAAVWFYVAWDPVQLARVRNGWLALAIGREECLLVGIGVFIACCICGWLAVRKHRWRFSCTIEP